MQRLPARLDVDQAALLLGFAVHDVPILIKARLLKPLGSPAPNGVKWFSAVELETLAQDRAWLDRATKTVQAHWKGKNRDKSQHSASRSTFDFNGADKAQSKTSLHFTAEEKHLSQE